MSGYRLTDLSALAGGLVVLALVGWARTVGGPPGSALGDLPEVALFVSFALLVLVPLGLGQGLERGSRVVDSRPYTAAVAGGFPAALVAVWGLFLPVGSAGAALSVVPWVGVTGLVAIVGLRRLLSRGLRPLPALAVDAAFLYVPVGAVALVLFQARVDLPFRPVIVFLTAVHYHYAGFVLPLVVGAAGERLADDAGRFSADATGRLTAASTVVVVVNLALIAVGITFSPLVEVVAVALFTVAVGVLAVLTLARVVPTLPVTPAALLAVAACSVLVTMVLALAYGYSAFPATGRLVTIGEMIRWHGTLNAAGFALPALVGFRLLDGSAEHS